MLCSPFPSVHDGHDCHACGHAFRRHLHDGDMECRDCPCLAYAYLPERTGAQPTAPLPKAGQPTATSHSSAAGGVDGRRTSTPIAAPAPRHPGGIGVSDAVEDFLARKREHGEKRGRFGRR